MKPDYTKLDAAILKRIACAKCICTWNLYAMDVQTEALQLGLRDGYRVAIRRIQALRKAGHIRYQRKPEGWVLVKPDHG